jgi:hypothetical protein
MTEPKPPDEIDMAFGSIMAKTPIEVKKRTPGEKEETDKQIEEENRRLRQQLPQKLKNYRKE